MEFDRSRFVDRELLDPARVMEGASHGVGRSHGGIHVENGLDNSLDFLKNPVDLGVTLSSSISVNS